MKIRKLILLIAVFLGTSFLQFGQTIGNKVTAPFDQVHSFSILSDDRIFVGTNSEGLYYSPDDGVTWIKITFPYDKVGMAYLRTSGDLYVDAPFNGLYRLKKDSTSWQYVGFKDVEVGNIIECTSGYLLASISSIKSYSNANCLYISKYGGILWSSVSTNFSSYLSPKFAKHPNGDIYVASLNGVYKSTTGESWTYCHPGTINTISIDADSIIYIGLEEELRTSSNEGAGWNVSTFTQKPFEIEYIFRDQQDNVYIETSNISHSFIYKKVKGTTVWSLLGELNGWGGRAYGYKPQINSKGDIFYIDASNLYKIDRTITSVQQEVTPSLPQQFILSQNYPNPFNPSTTINYSIPQTSFVILKVYDVLGNEVVTLVEEEKEAGCYKVEFNGSKLSSSIYLYRLQAGDISMTKKFILLK